MQLNAAQFGVWYGQRLDPDNPVFNQGGYMELRGPIDIGILKATLELMVAEDESLRLRFAEVEGVPAQHFGPAPDFAVDVVDVSRESDPLAVALEQMRADMAVVPDLERDRLFTHVLFVLGPEHLIWYNRAHHLIHDGHTSAILRRRAAEIYAELAERGEVAGPVFGSFARVLEEQAAYQGSAAQRRDASYWRKVMDGATCPANAGAPSNRVVREISYLDNHVLVQLREFSERAGVSWQQALIAAAVIHRYVWTGERDVLLSLPVSGRVSPAAQGVPGMMANVLPLRCGVDVGETCEALAARVAAQTLRAQWHQRYDSTDLLRDLGWPANGRRLFGPVINIFGDEPPTFAGTPMSMHLFSTGGTAEDLSLTVTRSAGDRLRVDVTIDAAYADTVDLGRYLGSFHRVVDSMTARAGVAVAAVDVLGADRGLVVEGWNATVVDVVDGSLGELFEARVAAVPDAVALVFG
ncbi:condensation domain-containing protein, partial [Allorhizocola rhizosphaerae]|uniref:condensation domain-containing protein n=1 Tax=Allorhizocola rhizosphaerae TaxID=1872709 RepID=UPI001B8BCAD8